MANKQVWTATGRRKRSSAQVRMTTGKGKITINVTGNLKNNKAKAIRFSTLNKLCEVLNCEPGDILEYKKDE